MIKNSLEWADVEASLMRKAAGLRYGTDVRRMIRNIQEEVKLLSRAEVEARRGKKLRAEELLKEINDDIETVEGFLVVAALLG